ncbi:hypothetical protein QT972_05800 [Microcoleus sp. herbarium7]|uniref:hypothetical protein n=1 Tax=Microcoleus sp. herbarium7 TaxID=3055435 RepID=UPI002FD18595
MNAIRTLIQLAATATAAAGLQVSAIGMANAALLTGHSTDSLSTGEGSGRSSLTVVTAAQTSPFGNQPNKYEPDPNGNPKSDGTGTR